MTVLQQVEEWNKALEEGRTRVADYTYHPRALTEAEIKAVYEIQRLVRQLPEDLRKEIFSGFDEFCQACGGNKLPCFCCYDD